MYIVVTQPHFYKEEADAIIQMFQSGLQRLHLRKPDSTIDECRQLLRDIPSVYHQRIVLHDHHQLAGEFAIAGVHLNSRNPEPPVGWQGDVSRSCHSLEEVKQWKSRCTYVTLSPIFDSISKQDYNAAFSPEQLIHAKEEGIIDNHVIALGGLCGDNIQEALSYGFGGVMVLGDAWKQQELPIVLTIAGSDTSAGAGIQQDLKTITNCGCYAATVITALTSQNTLGVQDVMPVPANVVESQLCSVFSDLRVDAVKIGMLPDVDVAKVVVKVLTEERTKRILPVVCDPIMLSTSGRRLMSEECIAYVAKELFPLCTLVTPNIPEHDYLVAHGYPINANLLLKGGHGEGRDMTDNLILKDENRDEQFTTPRIESTNLHGTGCTLSSAIASGLAHRLSLVPSVSAAKQYVTAAIEGGRNLHIGHGNGPLWCAFLFTNRHHRQCTEE